MTASADCSFLSDSLNFSGEDYLPPVHNIDYTYRRNPDGRYVLSEALAHDLDTAQTGTDFCALVQRKIANRNDLRMMAHTALTDCGNLSSDHLGYFFRLRSRRGIYWWTLSAHREENGTVVGRMHCYDERFYISATQKVMPDAVRSAFSRFIDTIYERAGCRVWFCREQPESGTGIRLPNGITLAVTEPDADAPCPGAVDCGLTDDCSALCRRLSDEFAIYADVRGVACDTAVVFLYLSTVGRAFEPVKFEFQPICDPDGHVAYVEMLARLHSDFIRVHPQKLITLLERGLGMIPFGRYVYEQAVQAAARLRRAGLRTGVTFNYCPIQCLDPGFSDFVKHTLALEGVPAASLMLELTESVPAKDDVLQDRLFDKCRTLGMRIALDDIGTGFNSVNVLLKHRFDLVKFSGELSRLMNERRDLLEFFRHAVRAVHSLGALVCTEHIETAEQLALSKSLGVDHIQGYYFSPPAPLEMIIRKQTENALQ